MAADTLAACVARSSAAMVLSTHNKQVLVFHEAGFHLPAQDRIENTNIFMFPQNDLVDKTLKFDCANVW